MSGENNSTWDHISSLNLTLDEEYSQRLASKEGRHYQRSAISELKNALYNNISSLPIKIGTLEHGVVEGTIQDISASGCRIKVPIDLKEGISVKVLININEKTMATVTELLNIGADVRGWEVKSIRGDVIDGQLTHVVSQMPKAGVDPEKHYGMPGSDELFNYDCLTTDNPILVNMVKTYFDIFWWRGENPRGILLAEQGKRFR